MTSTPSSPHLPPQTQTQSRPSLSRSGSSYGSLFGKVGPGNYESEEMYGWAGALTLLDVVETFFDSRIDLLERRLKAHSRHLKARAADLIPRGLRTPKVGPEELHEHGDGEGEETVEEARGRRYRRDVEKEVERIRLKLASKVTDLSSTWRSAQIVRTREKVSFLFGVLSLTFTSLLVGLAPEWLPFAWTMQLAFLGTWRVWDYKNKGYHYFLFECSPAQARKADFVIYSLCYFVNLMDLCWLWFFPSNVYFFITCYCLTMGPIASAIITWSNSLVFHSVDKVTSLFIHVYPPLIMTLVLHIIPRRNIRYPAVARVDEFSWWKMTLLSTMPYILWQGLYWKFVIVNRRSKIESGQRQTSFRYMLNDKRRPIGKMLQGIPAQYREASFMGGQLVYSIICMLPAACLLVRSAFWSGVFLVVVFSVAVWNGASYYVEVFGRKFERELEKLRREMEAASSTSQHSSTPASPHELNSPALHHAESEGDLRPAEGLDKSPLMLGAAAAEGNMEELFLNGKEDGSGAGKKDQ